MIRDIWNGIWASAMSDLPTGCTLYTCLNAFLYRLAIGHFLSFIVFWLLFYFEGIEIILLDDFFFLEKN